jgi:hypothetical protein
MADLMKGKRGLVMGVANDRSIAWALPARCMPRAQNWRSATRAKPLASGSSRWPPASDRICWWMSM